MSWFNGQPEWFRGAMAGGLIGFVPALIILILTIVWDIYKSRRESKERDDAVLSAIKEEVLSNIETLDINISVAEGEIEGIKERKGILTNPVISLEYGAWDLVKMHLPKKLRQKDRLNRVRSVYRMTHKVNELIRNRESFKNYNIMIDQASGDALVLVCGAKWQGKCRRCRI